MVRVQLLPCPRRDGPERLRRALRLLLRRGREPEPGKPQHQNQHRNRKREEGEHEAGGPLRAGLHPQAG